MASLRLFATRHATVSLRTLPVLPAVTTRAPLPRYFASAAMSSSRLIDEIKVSRYMSLVFLANDSAAAGRLLTFVGCDLPLAD